MTENPAAGRPAAAGGASLKGDIAAQGYGFCVVGGQSMLPVLRRGDVVRVERAVHIRRGDIVAAEIGGVPAIHRVVAVTHQGYICCGDHCRRHDPPVSADLVYGIVTATADGRRLKGGVAALLLARARFWGMLLPLLARTLADEVALLVREAAGSGLPPFLCEAGGPQTRDGFVVVLDPEQAIGVAAIEPGETVVEIPVGVYSGMSEADRVRLLARLSGRRVVVWGLLADGRRVRVAAALRRLLRRLGRRAGQPGDASVRDAKGARRRLHYFGAEELGDELRRAGANGLESNVVATLGGGTYVRATARL